MRKKILVLSAIFSLILTSGFGCKLVDKKTQEAMKPITITYWRVFDGPDAFDEIIANYKKLHPFVSIEYRKLRFEEYERELLEALAEDRGPDIFSIHNTWIRKYQNKLSPMPASITMAYPVVKGTIKKEVIPELRTTKSISLKDIKNNFVDAVYGDSVLKDYNEKTKTYEEKVYGLPLSMDTLALFYNKDLLNNAGIATPPAFWNKSFQENVKALTKQNEKGEILQSGVALGGSMNIERSFDIISLLMMQNGAEMLDDTGRVYFHRIPANFKTQGYNPGMEALRFYSDFANPAKEVYCWNGDLDNSLEAFSQGKLAMAFGYSYHLPTIKANAPKLNFGIAPMPQIEGTGQKTNFANYWTEVVSKKSKYINEAWDFIQFATKAEQAKSYLEKTKKPTALRSLVASQADDMNVGVFADQVLTAKSWYKGENALAAEKIIWEMIDSAILGQEKLEETISLAAKRVQQTIQGEETE